MTQRICIHGYGAQMLRAGRKAWGTGMLGVSPDI